VPFAKVGTEVMPLAAAPFVESGRLYVPMQLVAELLPRLGTGVLYDAERSELRQFFPAAGQRPPAVATARNSAPVAAPRVERAAPVARPRRRRLVVVDAGHGGPDNGMTGPIGGPRKLYEKNVTLAVSLLLAEALRARGVDVALTRARDTLIALADRGHFANERKADLFISIHVNAANLGWRDPRAARGFETYFLAEAKTEEESRVERMENEAVRFETSVSATKGDPLSFIMLDMAQNEHLRESSDLAATVQDELRRMHPGPDRGVKQANFAVLRNSYMPAVLVELGFGTNPTEAAYLTDRTRQRDLANAVAAATLEYLSHYERRVGTTAP
jgi:N-acetylmuramoyl-L-alanine amidase